MGWITITDGQIDAESALNEALFTALRDNMEYNHDRALRCGTHATGVRLALARGSIAISQVVGSSFDSIVQTSSVTFSTDADDGDPNFSATPKIIFTFEEDNSGAYLDWSSNLIVHCARIASGTLSTSGFTVDIQLIRHSGTGSGTITGTLHWLAIGAVSSGE